MLAPPPKRRRISPPTTHEASGVLDGRSNIVNDRFLKIASGWNLEQDYESRPRKVKGKKNESTRLPIKTADGNLKRVEEPALEEDDSDNFLHSEEEAAPKTEDIVTISPPKVPLKEQILATKEELARLASLTSEDPEEHIGSLRTFLEITSSDNATIKKLALATQLAVYRDIIPGYRIRPLTEVEQKEKVSKEVKKLRSFEQNLVSNYKNYVKELEKSAKAGGNETEAGIQAVAVSCISGLVLAVPHFNFRGQLIKVVVDKLGGRRTDPSFTKCKETLETLFSNDEDGNASLEAVTMLTNMIKARSYRIDESALNILLHLRLLSELSTKASKDKVDKPLESTEKSNEKKLNHKWEFRTKKQRKQLKERKAVEKDFREVDAIVSHEERERLQAEMLKMVFICYFRILKTRVAGLTGAVLEGLAKYAHLINQDFFGDVLEALKELTMQSQEVPEEDRVIKREELAMEGSSRDSIREALLCVNTAFALLEGQDVAKSASGLHLDLSFFTQHLYSSLSRLSLDPNLELSSKTMRLADPHESDPAPQNQRSRVNVKTTSALLLRSLSSILLQRSIPPLRLAAFVQQISMASLQVPEKTATALLGLLCEVTKTHGRRIASLWDTDERKGDGIFDPYNTTAEGSNPLAGTVWSGELLRLHFASGVTDGLRELETLIPGGR